MDSTISPSPLPSTLSLVDQGADDDFEDDDEEDDDDSLEVLKFILEVPITG